MFIPLIVVKIIFRK